MSQEKTARPNARPRGRPRSKAAHDRALATAREILLTSGFGQLTMESVAARSGVSKPTLYRHWANAQELAMSALVPPADLASGTAGDENGSDGKARLTRQLSTLISAFATTRGRQMTIALASANPESEFTKAFRNRILMTSRENGRAIIASAVAAGEMDEPRDIETLLDMIYGPIFYRLLMGHLPLEPQLAQEIADRAWPESLRDPR